MLVKCRYTIVSKTSCTYWLFHYLDERTFFLVLVALVVSLVLVVLVVLLVLVDKDISLFGMVIDAFVHKLQVQRYT